MSKQLTHGEAYVVQKSSLRLEDGAFICNEAKMPRRMQRADAIVYYNKKLYTYWLTQLDDSIPVNKKEKSLNFMLGRTT